jgi:nucleoside-diphosphate-sugar epimerase
MDMRDLGAWPAISADRALIGLLGHRSALQVRVHNELAACGYDVRLVDRRLPEGATLVAVSELAVPAHGLRSLRWRRRRPRMIEQAAQLGRDARAGGIATLVVLSSAMLYADDLGGWLDEASPVDPPPEAAEAEALEHAAGTFAALGGHAVVLRLGWPYGDGDRLTQRLLSAARNGWQMLDRTPGRYLPTIGLGDAATAATAALRAPPGTYNVTDGCPRTVTDLDEAIAAGTGRVLHPLYDGRWTDGPLFGRSRRLAVGPFGVATGWRPAAADAATGFIRLAQGSGG